MEGFLAAEAGESQQYGKCTLIKAILTNLDTHLPPDHCLRRVRYQELTWLQNTSKWLVSEINKLISILK